jgi:hypothetical protein|tara:strand:- start:691 stop:849 length:159 start_codon:yes stop_codon:yes gene_type:complete
MRGRLGVDIGITNLKILGSRKYLFTKYDEMVKNTEQELSKISNFLQIDVSKI